MVIFNCQVMQPFGGSHNGSKYPSKDKTRIKEVAHLEIFTIKTALIEHSKTKGDHEHRLQLSQYTSCSCCVRILRKCRKQWTCQKCHNKNIKPAQLIAIFKLPWYSKWNFINFVHAEEKSFELESTANSATD